MIVALIDNTMDITEPRRSNPEVLDKQFEDESGYQKYPGKLGHATLIGFKVGF